MGIGGLIPFVEKACRKGIIKEFQGKSIAVDVSCLLHKGSVYCMDKLAQGQETDFYVAYVLKYVQMLLMHHCHVVMVFDGRSVPAKKGINDGRREKRNANRARGFALLAEGKTAEAYEFFRKSTEITFKMVHRTIQACRKLNNVDVIVAPYESDAQLAYLSQQKLVHAVITEDSDLIVYGCEKVIFKLEAPSGDCTIYDKAMLPSCQTRHTLSGENFDFVKFRRICILTGCDYLETGLPGVGLKKASEFFAKTSERDLAMALPRIPRYLNLSVKITSDFISDFVRAENTFLHQVVFDPRRRCQLPLNPYENDKEGVPMDHTRLPYAGKILSDDEATQFALGNRDHSGAIVDDYRLPDPLPEWSMWNSNRAPKSFSESPNRGSPLKPTSTHSSSLGAFGAISPVKRVAPQKRLRNSPAKPPPGSAPLMRRSSKSSFNDDILKIYGYALPMDTGAESGSGCAGSQSPAATAMRSPYFSAVRSSSASSNPFKKPRPATDEIESKKEGNGDGGVSLLDELDKNDSTQTTTVARSSISPEKPTCRASGLTRTSSRDSNPFARFECQPAGLAHAAAACRK
uniref:Exonuclease 1 n=1 Tax=Plectus sambesii TaxID=2011161 RepID=A0A914V9W4_9BILA